LGKNKFFSVSSINTFFNENRFLPKTYNLMIKNKIHIISAREEHKNQLKEKRKWK
jgi:hypothetical protein